MPQDAYSRAHIQQAREEDTHIYEGGRRYKEIYASSLLIYADIRSAHIQQAREEDAHIYMREDADIRRAYI